MLTTLSNEKMVSNKLNEEKAEKTFRTNRRPNANFFKIPLKISVKYS